MRQQQFTAVATGDIGEHICALRLLKMHVPCSIINLGTSDIVAEYEGRMWRIQVKSSVAKRRSRDRVDVGYQFMTSKGGKKTPLTEEDCDIVAMVSIELERVWFVPVHKLRNSVSKRKTISFFDEDVTDSSWRDTMSYFGF
jgi:hypothetical protein